jgi:biopolymer transport protein ExbD
MIPLIDMFFLVLTFFIFGVFSMTMQEGILVDLPTAETAASTQDEALTVSVSADGALFLNREPVVLETLGEALRARAGSATDQLVILNADAAARHGLVVSVLDAVRRGGFRRVSFRTAPAS